MKRCEIGSRRIARRSAINVEKATGLSAIISIRINQALYDQAKAHAAAEHRTIAGQVEFWATVGRAALDDPDLPVSFVAESLVSLTEPRAHAKPFVPRRHAGEL